MDSQKLENILNLVLQMDKNERNQEEESAIGYDESTNSWELIVKYNGSLAFVETLGGSYEELILGYAIIILPEEQIEELVKHPEIEYVEVPKRLYYSILNGKRASCIFQTEEPPLNLSGRGVLVGILDSGERVMK